MQFFFATPKRLHRVHSHFFMIVLGMTEGGFLLPELLAALAFEYGAGDAEENPDVRVDFDYGGDLVRGAVRLGRAVEQMMDDAPKYLDHNPAWRIKSRRYLTCALRIFLFSRRKYAKK